MLLLGLSGKAMADNITFSDGEYQTGKFGVFTVYSTIEENNYNGFEIHWTAASQTSAIEITEIVPSNELLETYPDIVIDFNKRADYFVLMGWTSKSATEYLPKGENVPLCKVYFTADESVLGVGDKVTLDVDHGEFSLEGKATHFIGTSYGLANVDVPLNIVEPYNAERTIDENSKYEIEDSYGGFAEDITVIRSIKADSWSTLCLPFAIPRAAKNEIFGSGTVFATLTDEYEYDPEEKYLTLGVKKLSASSGLQANTFYFVKAASPIDMFTLKGVVVEKAEVKASSLWYDEASDADIPLTAVGVYKPQVIPEDAVFLSDNKFYYSTGKSHIKPMRGYLILDQFFQNSGDGEANIFLSLDDETTGIKTNILMDSDNVYSISGVYMGKVSDMKKLPRGIYIVNNKKVTVK
jgi:hypothetical protein